MKDIEAIVVIVERGKAEHLVEHAKRAGAKGATIFYGRGTGESEVKKFLNLHIEASKEVIVILTEYENMQPILDAVVKEGKLEEPGTGIVFSFPVRNLIGLHYRQHKE